MGTAVATLLTAQALAATPTATPVPDSPTPPASETPTISATSTPTQTPTPLPSNTPPPDGVSLNCDGTYQRVRITDAGIAGKTIWVDDWDGSAWVNVWSIAGGDANLRQLTDEAGWRLFGSCQKLILVPFRHSDPRVTIDLSLHVWNGAGLTQVYSNRGWFGEWSKVGDLIRFREASKLGSSGGGPLGACEWLTLEHTWDGTDFVQTGSVVEAVPGCTVQLTAQP